MSFNLLGLKNFSVWAVRVGCERWAWGVGGGSHGPRLPIWNKVEGKGMASTISLANHAGNI